MRKLYFGFTLLIIFSCERQEKITRYYDNGNLYKKYYKINGEANGKYYEYYKNGNLKIETNYKNNLTDGNYKEYAKNGDLLKKGKFFKGEAIGWFYYYRNGKIRGKRQYVLINEESILNQFILYDRSGNVLSDSSNYISVKKNNTENSYKVKLEASIFRADYAEFLVGKYTSDFEVKDSFSIDTIKLVGQLETTLNLGDEKKAIICDVLPMDSMRKIRFIYFDPESYEY